MLLGELDQRKDAIALLTVSTESDGTLNLLSDAEKETLSKQCKPILDHVIFFSNSDLFHVTSGGNIANFLDRTSEEQCSRAESKL